MSKKRISGKDFHINILGIMVMVKSASLTISDNRKAVKTRGVTDGYVDGDSEATGDIELDTQNFNLIVDAARKAGSFRALKPFDMQFYAETDEKLQIDAFGCLLKVDEMVNVDADGGEKAMHKLSFEVTDSDFVQVNGVPYLDSSELIGLTG